MNEKNLIKYIRQLEEQIKTLEEVENSDVTHKEILERNKSLKQYYIRKLKDHKWEWILKGGDINTLLN